MQQCVMSAQLRSGERGGVDGTYGGQGAVRTFLDVGFYIVERGCGLAADAGTEDSERQRENNNG